MKSTILATTLSLCALAATPALAGEHMNMNMNHDHSAMGKGSSTAMSEGTVKKVDKAGGKVTIAHGPLENLAMPAMTMAFPVKNATALDQVKVGDKVRFRAEQVNGSITIVALEPMK